MNAQFAAAVWVAVQIAVLAGWASYEHARLLTGAGMSILVRVEPVDPRDLLRGQYMQLGYEISQPRRFTGGESAFDDGQVVWAELHPEGDFYVPHALHAERPSDVDPHAVIVLGRIESGRIRYGVEDYYVPEGTPTPNWQDLTVRLRIGDDHVPRIEAVYLDGEYWP